MSITLEKLDEIEAAAESYIGANGYDPDPVEIIELVSLARSALSRSGEAVAPYVVLDEEGTALVPDDQAAAIKAAFEAVKPLAPFGKPLRRALKFYLADPPSSVPTGYKIVPEAAINALIERFAQIECQGITGQSIVTPQDLIDWTKGIAAAGYNEARAMLAASPTPKGGE